MDLEITFRITNTCNIECKYCHWNKLFHYKVDEILLSIDKIFELAKLKEIDNLKIYFHGGEPSFHPNIIDILKYINRKKMEYDFNTITNLQTNLSLNSTIYKRIVNEVNFLSISLHYKYLKQKNLLSQFTKNIYMINKLIPKIKFFDIMLEELNITEIKDFQKYVKILLKSCNFEDSEMIYSFCHYTYNPEILNIHKVFYNKYSVTKHKYFWKNTVMKKEMDTNEMFLGVDFTNSMCKAGNNYMVIEGNGLVFRCGSHMTNYIKSLSNDCPKNIGPSKPLGNIIIDDIYNFINKDKQCEWSFCGGDFYVPKYAKINKS